MKYKLITILSLALLILTGISTVSAETLKVANVTFYKIVLCEQLDSDYTPPYEHMSIFDSPCKYKKENSTKTRDLICKWLKDRDGTFMERGTRGARLIISTCQRYEFEINLKEPELKIFYDGTWLTFVKEGKSGWMNWTQVNEIRDEFGDEIRTIKESLVVALNCTSDYKADDYREITTVTYIQKYKPNILSSKNFTEYYPDLKKICRCDDKYITGGSDIIFYKKDYIGRHPRIDYFPEEVCFLRTTNYKHSIELLFQHLDWIREFNRIYQKEKFNDEEWGFMKDVPGERANFVDAYLKASKNDTLQAFKNFIRIETPKFRDMLDERIIPKFEEKEDFTNHTYEKVILRISRHEPVSNMTYLILIAYHEKFKEFNSKAQLDIASMNAIYARYFGDISMRYSMEQLSEQSNILHQQINESSNQFEQQITETTNQFRIMALLIIVSFLIPVGVVVVDRINQGQRKEFILNLFKSRLLTVLMLTLLIVIFIIYVAIYFTSTSPEDPAVWVLMLIICFIISLAFATLYNLPAQEKGLKEVLTPLHDTLKEKKDVELRLKGELNETLVVISKKLDEIKTEIGKLPEKEDIKKAVEPLYGILKEEKDIQISLEGKLDGISHTLSGKLEDIKKEIEKKEREKNQSSKTAGKLEDIKKEIEKIAKILKNSKNEEKSQEKKNLKN